MNVLSVQKKFFQFEKHSVSCKQNPETKTGAFCSKRVEMMGETVFPQSGGQIIQLMAKPETPNWEIKVLYILGKRGSGHTVLIKITSQKRPPEDSQPVS